MLMSPEQARAEQQRQTGELTQAINDLLRSHAEREIYPMLGAVTSALAHNLGETIGQVDAGNRRKALRDAATKVQRRAERNAVKRGDVQTVHLGPRGLP